MRKTASIRFLPVLLLLLATACGSGHGESIELAVAHYQQVETELLAVDTGHLTESRKAERERLIRELAIYREGREFTLNRDHPGARLPYFMDDEGRRCAIAHLLHVWGEDDLVARVAKANNHAYVSDLAGEPEVVAWLDRVGISAWEAARIQVPGRVPPDEEDTPGAPPPPEPESSPPGKTPTAETPPPDSPSPDTPAPKDGAATGPVGKVGSRPGSGGTQPGATGPAAGPGGGGRTLGGRTASPRAGSRRSASRGAESWWLWWEFNKLDYLAANPLRVRTPEITGTRTREIEARVRKRAEESRRAAVLPALLAELDHDDARVRGAAVIAVGRIGGAEAVPYLLKRLDDPQLWVRDRAILALGATGADEAGRVLLRIARTGSHLPRGKSAISPDARPLSILGLGLHSRYQGAAVHDAAVADLVAKAKKRDLEDLGGAGLLHGVLSPGERIDAVTVKIAMDQNAPDPVRARAIERLGTLSSGKAMPALQRTLAGPRLELRRSAALALAEVQHDLVLPRIMTAFELEKEPLTRGFLLLAIARQGGEKATKFLTRQLTRGPRALRPWAALALGLAAREGDRAALPPLRKAELSKSDQGAVWLALGLARDEESVPVLKTALGKLGSPRVRSHAATALALIGGERARHALLSRQVDEGSPGVKVVIAQCLGVMGHDEDAVVLLETLKGATRPEYSGVMAVGLGYHGADATLTGLTDLLGERNLDPVVRGTTISAIGLLLDRRPGLEFTALSRRTNFAIAPSWLYPALLSTL